MRSIESNPFTSEQKDYADKWQTKAKCAKMDEEIFFIPSEVRGKKREQAAEAAKTICEQCPVKIQCLHAAIIEEQNHDMDDICGIRGGTDPQERRYFVRNFRRTGELPTSNKRTYVIE